MTKPDSAVQKMHITRYTRGMQTTKFILSGKGCTRDDFLRAALVNIMAAITTIAVLK
jgi:hypothetical protein